MKSTRSPSRRHGRAAACSPEQRGDELRTSESADDVAAVAGPDAPSSLPSEALAFTPEPHRPFPPRACSRTHHCTHPHVALVPTSAPIPTNGRRPRRPSEVVSSSISTAMRTTTTRRISYERFGATSRRQSCSSSSRCPHCCTAPASGVFAFLAPPPKPAARGRDAAAHCTNADDPASAILTA